MAGSGEDQSSSLQDLFVSLRTHSNRALAANNRTDENAGPASSQAYPFNFMALSNPARASEPPQLRHSSSDMLSSSGSFPTRGAGVASPNAPLPRGTAPPQTDQSAADRTANLLNLLKFNQPGTSQSPLVPQQQVFTAHPEASSHFSTPAVGPQTTHARGVSASDLVASFMGRPTSSDPRQTMGASISAPKPAAESVTSPNANPQDFLLQLLNRPTLGTNTNIPSKPPAQAASSQGQSQFEATVNQLSHGLANIDVLKEQTQSSASKLGSAIRKESPIHIFGTNSKETTPFEPQDIPKVEPTKESIFTYVNPFEQLAASSPRNIKLRSGNGTPQTTIPKSAQLSANGEGSKRKGKDPSPAPQTSASRRKLTPSGSDILQSIEMSEPVLPQDGSTTVEALIGIGAPTTDPETVAEALNDVGEQVSRQVDHALAQAAKGDVDVKVKDEEPEDEHTVDLHAMKAELQDIAAEVREENGMNENSGILENIMPEEVAEATKDITIEAADGDIEGHQGSADDEKSSNEAKYQSAVPVYNFPMRPFVSIDLKQDEPCLQQIRDDAVMEIAKLKKEFDQIDRTLATASSTFILYAMPKAGGLRIIRQEDGADRQIFRETRDRIFNVAISTAAAGEPLREVQTSIATGMSGTVYWASVCFQGGDCIQEDNLEKRCLSFPPVASHDEHTSGGQLKTRAKKSSRHPEFFAIGRGKSIQILFPFHARGSDHISSNFVVDTEGYYKERSLKINTGKAGKDFTFSEDDTMITTLDKAGRLRFWDIRDLVDESNGSASKIAPIEVKSATLTFTTAHTNEKSWPTSVLYVDKLRPYSKCIALRYIIVGMKQNHTLQLWDLGLGKAVQELNFPHEKESDAICSVSYHSASGMIVVGHPTRNSIYFIHLSAPKYNLPPMSQAKFVQRLANKDSSLPKPESTAIMSGMREYSFSSKGQIRSVDLLPMSNDSARIANSEDDPSLFELYVMHSKGVTCLNIKKEDLGWSQDTKVMNPIPAEKVGRIEVRDLREPQPVNQSEKSSINGDAAPSSSMPSDSPFVGHAKESSKIQSSSSARADHLRPPEGTDNLGSTPSAPILPMASSSNGVEKSERKKKRRNAPTVEEPPIDVARPAPTAPDSYAAAALRARSPSAQRSAASSKETSRPKTPKSASTAVPDIAPSLGENESQRKVAQADSISLGISGDFLDKEFKKIEKLVSTEFSSVLGRELEGLYRRFDDDKRVQDAAGAAKQDAVLRLVSSTLTENVDRALSRIIMTSIQQQVLPSIADITASTLEKNVPEHLTQQLLHTLPAQLKLALPEAVSKSIQNADVLRMLSDQVTAKVATAVEKQITTILQQSILPAFQNVAVGAAQRMSMETERRLSAQMKQIDVQHQDDSAKIDQLTALVKGLSETVHAMAAAQSDFQIEILKLQRQNVQDRQTSLSKEDSGQVKETSIGTSSSPEPIVSPEQQEVNEITALMKEGRFEEGTIMVSPESQVIQIPLTWHSGFNPPDKRNFSTISLCN